MVVMVVWCGGLVWLCKGSGLVWLCKGSGLAEL